MAIQREFAVNQGMFLGLSKASSLPELPPELEQVLAAAKLRATKKVSGMKIYDKHRWKEPDTGKKTKELGGGILSLVKEEVNGEELWNSIKNEIMAMADEVLCYRAKTKK